ncbi:hypothetical protein AVEN_96153-1 [Araneus ventricosus]|uniref:Uncharacterized protein n=1 Tax=Araneus ventricosus TaxID=182803 RepID=A0A4Y2MCX6_ARAVE|nr:hypothetical protein AVEN_96153-1 [Araneus ventricosus]
MAPGSKYDSTEDLWCMWAWSKLNRMSSIKRSSAGVVRKLGEIGASSGAVLIIGLGSKNLERTPEKVAQMLYLHQVGTRMSDIQHLLDNNQALLETH